MGNSFVIRCYGTTYGKKRMLWQSVPRETAAIEACLRDLITAYRALGIRITSRQRGFRLGYGDTSLEFLILQVDETARVVELDPVIHDTTVVQLAVPGHPKSILYQPRCTCGWAGTKKDKIPPCEAAALKHVDKTINRHGGKAKKEFRVLRPVTSAQD